MYNRFAPTSFPRRFPVRFFGVALALCCLLGVGISPAAWAGSYVPESVSQPPKTQEEGGQEVEDFKLSLKPTKKTYEMGESVGLLGVLHNMGGEPRWVNGLGVFTYNLEIIRPDGTRAPLTSLAEHERKSSRIFPHFSGTMLYPDRKQKFSFGDINIYFDMKQAGQYQMRVSRSIFKHDYSGEATLTSNVVKIIILSEQDTGQKPAQVLKEEWGEETEGLKLSLNAEKKYYAIGEPVHLTATLKSVDRESLYLPEVAWSTYRLEILRPDGTPAPLTAQGEKIKENLGLFADVHGTGLNSGGKREEKFRSVNTLFDMTRVGDYRLRVSRRVPTRADPKQKITIFSNTVTIRIESELDRKILV